MSKYDACAISSQKITLSNLFIDAEAIKVIVLNQHYLERRPVHRNVATWQTSEVVGRAPKNYPDAIFK